LRRNFFHCSFQAFWRWRGKSSQSAERTAKQTLAAFEIGGVGHVFSFGGRSSLTDKRCGSNASSLIPGPRCLVGFSTINSLAFSAFLAIVILGFCSFHFDEK
jgi:hypothetical protein